MGISACDPTGSVPRGSPACLCSSRCSPGSSLAWAQPGARGAAPSTFSPRTGSQRSTGLSFTMSQLASHLLAQAARALEQGPCLGVLSLKCHQTCRQLCPGSIRGDAGSPAKSKGCKILSAGLLPACSSTTLLPTAPGPQNLSPAHLRCSDPIPRPPARQLVGLGSGCSWRIGGQGAV